MSDEGIMIEQVVPEPSPAHGECLDDREEAWTTAALLVATQRVADELFSFADELFSFGQEVTEASTVAMEASVLAVQSWSQVLRIMMRPVWHAAVLAWPSVRSALVYAAQRTAAQPKQALAAEAAVLVIAIAIWRLVAAIRRRRYVSRARAEVGRRYDAFRASVRRRSRRAAAALPHILFMAACVAASRVLTQLGLRPRALAVILSCEPYLSTGLPALRTLLALGTKPPVPIEQQRLILQYWVVWATAHLVSGFVQTVPFATRIAQAAVPLIERTWWPLLHELPFCGYLWLQLPARRGRNVEISYELIAPELSSRAERAGALQPHTQA